MMSAKMGLFCESHQFLRTLSCVTGIIALTIFLPFLSLFHFSNGLLKSTSKLTILFSSSTRLGSFSKFFGTFSCASSCSSQFRSCCSFCFLFSIFFHLCFSCFFLFFCYVVHFNTSTIL